VSSIDILPSPEQTEIVDGLARVLTANGPGKTGIAEIAELGYLGANLPEEFGGFGLTIADEALLHIELGRTVADLRVLATLLAARLAAADGNTALCSELASGVRPVGFAMPVYGWPQDSAGPCGECYLLGDAGLYIALSPQGGSLVSADNITDRQAVESLDATASATRARVVSADAWSVGGAKHIWLVATIMAAAHAIGIGAAALAMGAEYAKVRVQFDKPIGAFQGIAHPLAECAMRSDAAQNQLYYAAIALRDGFEDAARQVTAAWLVAMDAGLRNATTNIQTHGAMGYSAETGAHLFLKRAVILRQLSGGVRLHERAMLAV